MSDIDSAQNSCAQKLREEIMAYEDAQRQAGRWGLLGICLFAALGMGVKILNSEVAQEINRVIILCVIPLFSAYCVLLRRKFDIRIAIIASFLCDNDLIYGKYESHINKESIGKTHWKIMPILVNILPAAGACLFVLIYGYIGYGVKEYYGWLIVSSCAGLVFILIVETYYEWADAKIRGIECGCVIINLLKVFNMLKSRE